MIILYQCTGKEVYLKQAALSISSLLLQTSAPINIVVYTDNVDFFKQFHWFSKITFERVTAAELENWMKPSNFFLGPKLHILKNVLEKYKKPVVFCDTDTIHTTSFELIYNKVNESTSVFHVLEGELKSKSGQMLWELHFYLKKDKVLDVNSATMYNTGLIGIHPANVDCIDRSIELMHKIFRSTKKHVSEQLAISIELAKKTKILTGESLIHYWHLKDHVNGLIMNADASEFDQLATKLSTEISNYDYVHRPPNWAEIKLRIRYTLGI